jgi:glycine/D-amino acid oxidase-like deaminating enzyme
VKIPSVDVAVIGGGVVGAAIAYGLACVAPARARIAMLDEGDTVVRAARGNFGLVWVQGKGVGSAAYAQWTRCSAQRWPELAARLRDDTGIDVALSQRGGLRLCLGERELEQRRNDVARMQADPALARVEMLDRTALASMLPGIGPEVAGASYCADDGQVDPLRLLRALHAGFRRRGGRLGSDARVRALKRTDTGFTLDTARGALFATQVVLAAGLGSRALAGALGLTAVVTAQRGEVVVLGRLPPFLPLPIETLRQMPSGAVLLGDSHETTESTGTAIGVLAHIARRALQALPALAKAPVLRTWGALRVLTPDGAPVYARAAAAPGAVLACCHSGVTLAAAHALELAPQIVAGALDPALQHFNADRFNAGRTVAPAPVAEPAASDR